MQSWKAWFKVIGHCRSVRMLPVILALKIEIHWIWYFKRQQIWSIFEIRIIFPYLRKIKRSRHFWSLLQQKLLPVTNLITVIRDSWEKLCYRHQDGLTLGRLTLPSGLFYLFVISFFLWSFWVKLGKMGLVKLFWTLFFCGSWRSLTGLAFLLIFLHSYFFFFILSYL